MLPSDLDQLSPFQRLILERALVLAQELELAAEMAPEGQIIDRCEALLLGKGRDFLTRAFESALQARVDVLEKKGAPRAFAHVVQRDRIKAKPPRSS